MQRLIIKKLQAWKESPSPKPLLLEGARQVGKTYILKEFGEKHFRKYHYINFEDNAAYKELFEKDFKPERIIRDLKILFDFDIDLEQDLIIFDEIQQCPKALTSLKYFCENLDSLYLIAAGSLLGIKLGEFSFPVGKVEMLSMHSMCFREFVQALNKESLFEIYKESSLAHEQLWDLLKIYFVVGGLPEVVQAYIDSGDFELVRKKQSDLIKAYNSDIAKHSGKSNSMHIEALWRSAAYQLGSETEGGAPKFRFKDSAPNIKEFSRIQGALYWLLKTGLLLKSSIIKKANLPLQVYQEENKFKLFVFDVGLLGAMVGLAPATLLNYSFGTYKGFFAENFVAQELCCAFADNEKLFTWKGKQSEIEFVLDLEGKVVPLEVKSGKITKSKSLFAFTEKYQPELKIISSAKPYQEHKAQGLLYLPLYAVEQFLRTH